MITKEDVYKRLDEMHRGEKSRKFLTHLIKAYFPVGKAEKVFDKPKGRFKCAISDIHLLSVQEVFEVSRSNDYFENMMEHIKSGFNTDGKQIEHPLVKAFGDKRMGITSNDTDTFIAMPVYQIFYEWLVDKVLKGDKHINWAIKQANTDMFNKKVVSTPPKNKEAFNKPRTIDMPIIKKVPKLSTSKTTLGDFGGLQELKQKLELIEKNKI
jgi:hypothetical protein